MHAVKQTATACVALLCVLLLWSVGLPVSANEYYTDGRIVIATEPEELSEHLEYYVDGELADISQMEWVEDGHTGRGLRLNGQNQYLRLGNRTMRVRTFTFTGWINWQGSADPENPDAAYNQHLFTIAKGQENWLTFSPHMRDAEKGIDGAYLGYKLGESQTDIFKPADSQVSYGLWQNQWHHVAVVLSETELFLYIDATLYLSTPLVTYVGDLNANGMYIGGSAYDDPLLNAVIDDMCIYEYDLTYEQILRVYNGIDPSDTETPLPTQPSVSRPTEIPTTMRTATGTQQTAPQTFFSSETGIFDVPLWGLRLVMYLLGTAAVLSVAFSVYEIVRHRERKH